LAQALVQGWRFSPRQAAVDGAAAAMARAEFGQKLCSLWRRCRITTPWIVPAQQPIELFFFQRVFHELSNKPWNECDDEAEEQEVLLMEFERAMIRLNKVIQKDDKKFNAADYDVNKNGRVGWFEFCSLWKEGGIQYKFSMAERAYLTLEDSERSILGKIISVLVFITILVSTGSFILSTVPEMQNLCLATDEVGYDESCKPRPKSVFQDIDFVTVIFFTFEYGIRLLLSAFMRVELIDNEKNQLLAWMCSDEAVAVPTKFQRVVSFVLNWANLVDLAAIMPWYLSEIFKNSGGEENIFIKIIRLTRVIRAFRLGRRFEAVIIIVRSLKKSLRAIRVLMLNLLLGMIIFGALMYFAEGGTWDTDVQAYMRTVGQEWNATTYQWEDVEDKSPFDSIPASFWWAIVTATTVGYGDHFPTTPAGKLVAAISMVWSLCVLALPIGVIGGNFSQVWDEYDTEKAKEKENLMQEAIMVKKSAAWGDPLQNSRRLVLELWHDSGLPLTEGNYQAEFMGEVETFLDLTERCKNRKVIEPLTANFAKAHRNVTGLLTFEYSWEPNALSGPDVLVNGKLEVRGVKADNVISIDWKGGCLSDPFVKVIANPGPPSKDATSAKSGIQRSKTVHDTTCPQWDEIFTFEILWRQAATEMLQVDAMKQSIMPKTLSKSRTFGTSQHGSDETDDPSGGMEDFANAGALTPESRSELCRNTIPDLQMEIGRMKTALPQLQTEIVDIRRDVQLIYTALKRRKMIAGGGGHGASDDGAGKVSPGSSSSLSPAGHAAPDAVSVG